MADSHALWTALDERLAGAALQVADLVVRPGSVAVFVEHGDASAPSLDELEQVSRDVVTVVRSELGDVAVEVSSPGLERRLRRIEQARAVLGRSVAIRREGGRLGGVLVGVEGDELIVEVDGEPQRIAWGEVREAQTTWSLGTDGADELDPERSGRNDGR